MQDVKDAGAPKRFAHVVGLDGLRGYALVIGPLLYHLWPGVAPGGVVSIDVFFVLSAYLITTLGLRELDRRDGEIDVSGYTTRRLRRLVPVLFLTVGAVVLWAALEPPDLLDSWIGGSVASIFGVMNWFLIAEGESYFSLFGTVSPLRHIWSLSIEMQFYAAAPVLLILVGRSRRWGRVLLLVGATIGALASAWWMAHLFDVGDDPSRVYYGTDTRAQSLLVGVALAAAVALWGPVRTKTGRMLALVIAHIGIAGHIAMVALGAEGDTWLYEYGGFLLAALLGAAMVMGALQAGNRGPAFWIVESAPLVWLGKVSYGLYLYHWPIIQFLTPQRTGLDGHPLAILRLTVSLAATALSWVFIEQVVLRRKPTTWPMAFATASSIAVLMAGLLWVGLQRPPEIEQIIVAAPAEPADGGDTGPAPEATEPVEPGAGPTTTTVPDRPFRLLLVGDSILNPVGEDLRLEAESRDLDLQILNDTHLGCVITRYGDKRVDEETEGPVGDVCSSWADPAEPGTVVDPEVVSWPSAIAEFQPDAVLLNVSPWDATDRRIPSLGPDWVHAGQPAFDDYARSEYELAVDTLTASGATLYLLTGPPLNRPVIPQNDPERIERLNELALEAADGREDVVIVDVESWIGPIGGERDVRLRGDGLHFSPEGREEVVDWLFDEVLDMQPWLSRTG